MKTVNIQEAKTHLSRLVAAAAAGESFVTARAGKPLVKVIAFDPPPRTSRLGGMIGEGAAPDDFDTMCAEEIRRQFEGRDDGGDPGGVSAGAGRAAR